MERQRKLLTDIVQAVDLISEFTIRCSSFSEYVMDIKTISAVERQLGIIGEAVTQLKNGFSIEFAETPQIISFRNRLIHAYDSVDDSIVWG